MASRSSAGCRRWQPKKRFPLVIQATADGSRIEQAELIDGHDPLKED